MPGRDTVKRWESGKVIPGKHWQQHLSLVLQVPLELLAAEANLDRVNRRSFISLTALVAAHGPLAKNMIASVGGRDSGPLTKMQTTHGTDIVIASLADRASTAQLRRWMNDGDVPILRVNAAGILAKIPGQHEAVDVVRVLTHDDQVRQLYMTAVASRVCAVDWTTAGRIAQNPSAFGRQADFLASRFAQEALNPHDAGARWCSSVMLRELTPLIGRNAT